RLFLVRGADTTSIYTLSLHDALPIFEGAGNPVDLDRVGAEPRGPQGLQCAGDEPLGDALVEAGRDDREPERAGTPGRPAILRGRSEEHTSELQSLAYLVCRLLLEKKK